MGKRKITYQSKDKLKIAIVLTGNVFLQYVDDDNISLAQKGDLLVYANNEALNTTHIGEYDRTGFSGYFKVDISDGKNWQPLIISNIFTAHENHFSKKERAIDTYAVCREMLVDFAGNEAVRTYREHYELALPEV